MAHNTKLPPGTYYGRCGGGPFHGRMLVHHELEHPVAVDHRGRFVMCVTAPAGVSFGLYRFDQLALTWVWHPPKENP